MKKNYDSPRLVIVDLSDAEIIATSATVTFTNEAADNSPQLGRERTTPIWDE